MSPLSSALLLALSPLAGLPLQHGRVGEGTQAGRGDDGYDPRVEGPSEEGAHAMVRFELMPGFAVSLFAAEPHLANPVAIEVDGRGRVFVAETFRHTDGVTDMRSHQDWLDEDLANRTVEERVAMMKEHEGDAFERKYAVEHERVRRIVDVDGDGVADESTVFADGFAHPAAGIGAGVLEREGHLYFTCIPDLVRLVDADDDGVAEAREVLHTGYGVNIALLGHDLHGLRIGPDGRLYFSIGDRGFHVETEGRTLAHPHCGAVLRCELDGSGLEVFATGLRNPQELVFDDFGDLFTGDNNSDGGDRARWVWVLEGGDSGWRYAFQWMERPSRRGPWNGEKMWHPHHREQPAFLVPPIANFADGPSGLTIYPGTGFGPEWNGTFFLCDFRGSPSHSGIHSYRNRRKGAGFELVDARRFAWSMLPTDCEFGPDGALYVSDWVNGWNKTGKGRIYRIEPAGAGHPTERTLARDTAEILAAGPAGMRSRRSADLMLLLAHPDRRVRQEAQFALAARAVIDVEAEDLLVAVARGATPARLARLHAIWAMGQVARQRGGALERLLAGEDGASLLADGDLEVRCQVARVLADSCAAGLPPRGLTAACADLQAVLAPGALEDLGPDGPRTQLFAAEALGRIGAPGAVGVLTDVLRSHGHGDAWLRHALLNALSRLADADQVLAMAQDGSPEVRRGAAVIYRKWKDPAVGRLLDDPDALVAGEAARAIYDEPIHEALPALAAALEHAPDDDPWRLRRMVSANARMGREGAERIARLVERGTAPDGVLAEALDVLADWGTPSGRDRIVGAWRPFTDLRAGGDVRDLASRVAFPVFASGSEKQKVAWARLVEASGARESESVLVQLVEAAEHGSAARIRALEALVALDSESVEGAMAVALSSEDDRLRARGTALLGRVGSEGALGLVTRTLESGSVAVRQGALTALGGLGTAEADAVLERWLARLSGGTVEAPLRLELVEAASARAGANPRIASLLEGWVVPEAAGDGGGAPIQAGAGEASLGEDGALPRAWTVSLEGGDAQAGGRIFFDDAEVGCLRCHVIGDRGGTETGGQAGPDLSDVGARLGREQLLRSLLVPNAEIAEGFENWIVVVDGLPHAGRILSEQDGVLVLDTKDQGRLEFDVEAIEARKRDVSAMPEGLAQTLGPRRLRDLVEFLAGRRSAGG